MREQIEDMHAGPSIDAEERRDAMMIDACEEFAEPDLTPWLYVPVGGR